jgi:undecaprenyl-diphosphatase
MDWIDAIIIGIVEGITEYLPVSSTGHILLAQRVLGVPGGDAANAFAVVIQAGAILAVLGLYFPRVKVMAMGMVNRNHEGLLLVRNLLLAFVPAAVFGLLFDKKIEERLFGLWPVTAAWFVGGVAILAVAWFRRSAPGGRVGGLAMEQITPRIALTIGLLQCVAMWPGTSRSLMTIVGGLVCGLNMLAAVEFSFLLGMITLTAAAGLKAMKFVSHPEMLKSISVPVIVIGIVASWLSAVLAVKWLVSFLQRRGITPFGYYRIGLGVLVAILLLAGVLHPTGTPPPAAHPPPEVASQP